jgi:molybdopterin-synthase adenylyltransferase
MENLSVNELRRYSRQLMLPEIGPGGQEKLKKARVLVIGGGGLGSPALLYLAAAGIGTLCVVDDDLVDETNLQRQVLHDAAGVGLPKVDSAAAKLTALNPHIAIRTMKRRLEPDDVELVRGWDVVLDGSDNFRTRFAANDACVAARTTLVSGAVLRFRGQISTYKPHAGPEHPCLRCLFPEPPAEGEVPSCAEGGVLGTVAGMIGVLQATETIKEILGIGRTLSGRLLTWDALNATLSTIEVSRDPSCAVCGTH